MPFDANPTETDALADNVLARLELLQEIAAQHTGDQGSFDTCLWSAVTFNTRLAKAGMPYAGRSSPDDSRIAGLFFGLTQDIWGKDHISVKRHMIDSRIRHIRQLACLRGSLSKP